MAELVNGIPREWGTLTNTGGTANLGSILGDVANTSIATRLGYIGAGLGPHYSNLNYLAVTADMTSATWNAATTQEVFVVTGLVRMRMWIVCTGTLTDAADLAVIQFGVEGATNAFIGATDAAGKNGQTITDTWLWYDTSPNAAYDTFATVVMDYVINGLDVGYEIAGEALNAGSLVFHCVWEPLNATGAVAAGAGGAL
jgi:hypothetical protein